MLKQVRTILGLLLLSISVACAQDAPALPAPNGWGGETIKLPPGFARNMTLRGVEHIRFAPGMMKPGSDSFFCYAFVFELEKNPELTDEIVRTEFLKYYRGLCTAVLKLPNETLPNVDPAKFTLKLNAGTRPIRAPDSVSAKAYDGVLDWVEPFATKKLQTLHLEIDTWSDGDRNYLFACVSPQPKTAEIWNQLHTVRDDYRARQHPAANADRKP